MASNDVVVRLVADVGNLQKGMDEAKKSIERLKSSTEQTGSNVMGAFKKIGTAVVGAFAIDKLKDFTIGMIETTASVQALDSQFQSTFKGEQGKALEGITKQAKEQGINVDRLKGTWASFYGTFKGNGADANQSLELTSRYMKLAGDGSAYYDLTLEDVSSRLKSITMGNFEAGDAIGLNLNVTKLDTVAKEKYNKKWQELNDTQKEFLVLDTAEKIYENSGAMGQGQREANNWTNVLANLKASWERFLSIVGSPFLTVATNLVLGITEIVGKLQSFASFVKQGTEESGMFAETLAIAFDNIGMSGIGDLVIGISKVVDGVKNAVIWFSQMGTGATILATAIGALTLGLITFNLWLKAGAIALKVQTIAQTVYNVVVGIGTGLTTLFSTALAVLTSPFFLIGVAIAVVIALGIALYRNWDLVKAKAGELGAWISAKWSELVQATGQAWNGIVAWISSAWTSVSTAVSNGFASVVQWFTNGWNRVVNICRQAWTWITSTVSAGFTAVSQWFVNGWNRVVQTCKSAWTGICNIVQVGILLVISIVDALFKLITIPIMFVWENIKTYVFQVWSWIRTTVTNGINAVVSAVTTFLTPIVARFVAIWDAVSNKTKNTWETLKSYLITAWNFIANTARTIFIAYQQFLYTVHTAIMNFVQTVWNSIKSFLTTLWNGIKAVAMSVFNAVASVIRTVFTAVSSFLVVIWNSIRNNLSAIWNSIKALGISAWNSLKSAVISAVNSLSATLSAIWNGIRSVASSIWNGIRSTISSIAHSASSSVSSAFSSLRGTVSSIWNGIKSAMVSPIEQAKSRIAGLVNAIKSLFNIRLEFPQPRMPHFSIDGSFSLNPPSVPHLAVDWYKTGGIATGASIVGIGEAGDEAIVPLSDKRRMKPFAQAVAGMMPDKDTKNSADNIVNNFNIASVVIREEADIEKIATQLYRKQVKSKRGIGGR